MKNLFLFTIMFSTISCIAHGQSCREAYIQVYKKIKFQPDNLVEEPAGPLPIPAVFGATLAGGTTGISVGNIINPGLGSTVSVVAGGTIMGATVGYDAITKYEDWWSNGLGVVLSLIEESRVGVGHQIKKTADYFKTSSQNIIGAVSELDSSGILCNEKLVTEKGIMSLIQQKLQNEMLNTGVLK